MSWVRLDDGILDHPKFIALENDALVLWLQCLVYCNAQLTDGALPEAVVRTLAARRGLAHVDPEVLVAAGLWERVTGGFRIHDYEVYQPKKEDVVKQRADAAERKRRSRARHGVTVTAVTGTGRDDDDDPQIVSLRKRSSSSSPVTGRSHRDRAVTLGQLGRDAGIPVNGLVIDEIEETLRSGVPPALIEEKIQEAARHGARSWQYVARSIESDDQATVVPDPADFRREKMFKQAHIREHGCGAICADAAWRAAAAAPAVAEGA